LALDADALVRASQALFKADNFPLAHQVLQQALAKAPEHAGAKHEHKNQYYYHAYSDWLMQTTEGRSDWYQADGLSERPNWKTAVDLCRPYIVKPRDAIAAHDLRQWTQAGLLWAEEHWDRQDHARAIAILRETLAPLTAGCPPELTKALIETIETARATPEADRSAASQRLQEALTALDTSTMTVPEWLCLYDLLNWNGLLQLGYLAREHAVQRAFRQADAERADPASLQQGARAALDQGELERAGRYLARLPAAVQQSAAAAELRAVQALFAGDLEGFRRQWPHPPRPVDQRFRDYLRGKSVAVVGPAPTGSADGAEIDGFDVVVRMNWRGPESLPDAAEFGSKTNVALYNAHTVRLLSVEGRLGLLKDLDFCLIRRPRHDLNQLPWNSGKVRMLSDYSGTFYKSLNAVPAALFDVLLHGAERIKLFKVNFYLLKQQYTQQYRSAADSAAQAGYLRKLQPIFANHDLLTQIHLVSYLLRNACLDLANGSWIQLRLHDQAYIVTLCQNYKLGFLDFPHPSKCESMFDKPLPELSKGGTSFPLASMHDFSDLRKSVCLQLLNHGTVSDATIKSAYRMLAHAKSEISKTRLDAITLDRLASDLTELSLIIEKPWSFIPKMMAVYGISDKELRLLLTKLAIYANNGNLKQLRRIIKNDQFFSLHKESKGIYQNIYNLLNWYGYVEIGFELMRKVDAGFEHKIIDFFNKEKHLSNKEKINKLVADSKFSNYINGKNVAIVGPAPTNIEHGAEIDSYDVIVRMNYFGQELCPKKYGSRTDVSFYNGLMTEHLASRQKEIDKCLNFLLFNQNAKKHDLIKRLHKRGVAEYLLPTQFPRKRPNALQLLCADIINRNPQSIKLFNLSFYYNKVSYAPGYKVLSKTKSHSLKEYSLIHDILENFIFVRNLFNKGSLKCDENIKEILLLDSLSYLKGVQQIYCF
jgi:hypothetical protein